MDRTNYLTDITILRGKRECVEETLTQTIGDRRTNRHTHMVGSVCSGAVIRKGGVHT